MERYGMNNKGAVLTTAVLSWGVTAYTYINTGFSIAMIVFALFFLWDRWKRAPLPRIHLDRKLLWAMAILYGTLAVTTLFHLDHMKNLSGGYYCLTGFLMYTFPFWMLLYLGGRYDIRKTVVYTLYTVLYAMCVYGLIKYAVTGEYRLTSFYSLGTRVSMMMDMFFPFTVAAAVYYRKEKHFLWISLVLIALEILTLIFCKVRGTYLAFSIALLVTGVVWSLYHPLAQTKKIRKFVYGAIALVIVGMVVYGVSLGWGSMHRMLGEERLLMWESSWHMWLDHPLVGIGLNDWQSLWADSQYTHPLAKEYGAVHPHNVFIYFFTTAGTLGGLAYVAYCVLLFKVLLQKIRRHGGNPFNWAMLFIFVTVTAHGLVDQNFILKLTGRIYYFMLGFSVIADWWYERERSPGGPFSEGGQE